MRWINGIDTKTLTDDMLASYLEALTETEQTSEGRRDLLAEAARRLRQPSEPSTTPTDASAKTSSFRATTSSNVH